MLRVGQKVVCVNTECGISGTPHGLKNGKIYTIKSVSCCPNCFSQLVELEDVLPLNKYCGKCYFHLGTSSSYHSYRFIPFDDITINVNIKVEINYSLK